MNVDSILPKSYRLTNTDSTTFLDGDSANVLADLNTEYGKRILDILNVTVDENASIQKATCDLISTYGLVEGQNGYKGEYSFPSNLLRPTRFEISYDGTTWTRATIYDNAMNEGSEYVEDQFNSDFSESAPQVDFNRDCFQIRPTKTTTGNITKGIYIEYERRQTDLTTGSPEFEQNLHDILAFDLANLEYMMHSQRYSTAWRKTFNSERDRVEKRFFDFHTSRFKYPKTFSVRQLNFS